MRPLTPFARSAMLIAATLLLLGACERAATPPPAAAPPAEPADLPAPSQPSVVDRAELLRALDAAASAFAAGRAIDSASLDGRRFVVRSAFGCGDPAAPGAAAPAGLPVSAWGPRRQTIELALQPADWTAELAAGGDAPAEAIEGFWLARPWMREDVCPARPASPPAAASDPASASPPVKAATDARPPLAPQTAGLASVFVTGGSRVGRRDGRAFTYTVRGNDAPPAPPPAGYRVVIEGRFTAFPGGGTVRCRVNDGIDQRPACLAASTIDRVVFETATGQMLSEWRPG